VDCLESRLGTLNSRLKALGPRRGWGRVPDWSPGISLGGMGIPRDITCGQRKRMCLVWVGGVGGGGGGGGWGGRGGGVGGGGGGGGEWWGECVVGGGGGRGSKEGPTVS